MENGEIVVVNRIHVDGQWVYMTQNWNDIFDDVPLFYVEIKKPEAT